MVDPDRLSAAYETARCDLLAETNAAGHWVGELSSSALATATAISALALVERHAPIVRGEFADPQRESQLSQLMMAGIRWLSKHQNPDGGWGDTPNSRSNIAATMLVRAAFALTAVPADCPEMLERADAYIKTAGGVRGVKRRYGRDKIFAVPVLTNCALAGLVPWRAVPALPFEWSCFPQNLWKSLRLPVVSCAIPALVAIGQARYYHRKPLNPIVRLVRRATVVKSLELLENLQPPSGGFLEATPLTSFIVMSLASIGRADHPVVRKGVEFIIASVRRDGSWPIDTNLATWNTTMAVNALAAAGEDLRELPCLDWVLSCQHREPHADTGAASGGWAWTDLSGAVPDADDTSSALLALSAWSKTATSEQQARIQTAAGAGATWLLDLQNSDGGWPTFSRGWGKLPFDRSGSDLTAHAMRALAAWRATLASAADLAEEDRAALDRRVALAMECGLRYLVGAQHADGYWVPLWFGNEHRPQQDNPVYGTAKVLAAFRDLGRLDSAPAARGLDWLAGAKHSDGSWGGDVSMDLDCAAHSGSVEETALATECLVTCGRTSAHEAIAAQGLKWLIDRVEANGHHETAPIGFYFAKLWYYEKLYPLVMTVGALGQAARRLAPQPVPRSVQSAGKT